MAGVITLLPLLSALLISDGGRISGRVVDKATGSPIPGATVLVRPAIRGNSTDAQGSFVVTDIPDGNTTLLVSHIGYRTVTLSGIRVTSATDTLVVIELDEAPIQQSQVVVTAGRKEQSLADVPVSISTVDASEVAGRTSITVDEALRHVSGVNIIEDQINIRGSSGYSRGVGSRVLLLLDGIPLLTGDTGEINWETIPVHQVERIEVVKGPGSAMYGSSALGGVVNVITRPAGGSGKVLFRGYGGVYDHPTFPEWRWSSRRRWTSGIYVSTETRIGSLATTIGASRIMDEGFRENDVVHRYGLTFKADVPVGDHDALTISMNGIRRRNGNFFWWRSQREATRPPLEHLSRWVTSTRGSIAASYKSLWNDGTLSLVRLQYFGNDWSDETAGMLNNRSRSNQIYSEWQLIKVAGDAHTFVGGLTLNLDRVASNLFGTHPGFGVAAFLQDDISISDDLAVNAGLRFDWQKVSALSGAAQVDPKLGLSWKASPTTSVRASIGTGFRYPSIGELFTSVTTGFGSVNVVPNPNLRAERSVAVEAGLRQAFSEHAWLDASVFQSDYEDLIEAGVHPTLLVIRFDNVKRARIRGAEATLGAEWFERLLTTTVGGTLLDPRDVQSGKILKFRPRILAVSSASLSLSPFSASVDYRYVSRIEVVDEDLITIADIEQGSIRVPIHVVDVRTSIGLDGIGIPLRMGVAVRNLLHYRYVELSANLGPPRTVLLTVDGVW